MQKIRTIARIFLINNDNTLLLLQVRSELAARRAGAIVTPSYWITPGGGLEAEETPEQAARRELFEETGIDDAEFVLPHVHYEEIELIYKGELTLFKEYFFVARTMRSDITTHHHTPEEQRMIIAHAWWSLDQLTRTTERVFPLNLVDIVKPYMITLPQNSYGV